MPRFIGFYLNETGKGILEELRGILPGLEVFPLKKEILEENWQRGTVFLFVMATGIVVRMTARFLKDKRSDPGVIVISEDRKWVIPLLGGHSAETNALSKKISDYLGSNSVVTTASDTKGLTPLDNWIRKRELKVKNPELLPRVMGSFRNKGFLKVWRDEVFKSALFPEAEEVKSPEEAEVLLTNKTLGDLSKQLVLIVPSLWLGIGLHEWVSKEDVEAAVREVLSRSGLCFEAIKGVATIDKKLEVKGLKEFCSEYSFEIKGFSKEELSKVKEVKGSSQVEKAVGTPSVSEASAILASRGKLLVGKRIFKDITLAIGEEPYSRKGKLWVVGTGPGGIEHLSLKALSALREAEVIVGYKTYLSLVKPLISTKACYSYGMTEEVKRAKQAVKMALSGFDVAVVSGGDPGIYGMAALVLEVLAVNHIKDLRVEVIPGISALNACAALAGSPLTTDFAVISLSDRLTPWEEIEKRLKAFASLDIPIVIFNPRSKSRQEHLSKALAVLTSHRTEDVPVAVITSATREDEKVILTNLGSVKAEEVGMSSLLIIGCSSSFRFLNWLITPRGYRKKYGKDLSF